jgi:hypothetical protein
VSLFPFGYDFYYLWAAGSLLHQGKNPYDTPILAEQLAQMGWPPVEAVAGFTHPFTILWLYWAFAALPFNTALGLWTIVSSSLIAWCCCRLSSLLLSPRFTQRRIIVFAVAAFPPALSNFVEGQVNALLLVGITSFALAYKHSRFFLAGGALSFTICKPHALLPMLIVIALCELIHRRYRLLVGLALGSLVQLVCSYALAPDALHWYLRYLPTLPAQVSHICGNTLAQQLECLSNWSFVRPTLLFFGVLASITAVRRYGYSTDTLLRLVVPISVLVAPFLWVHSMIILFPALIPVIERLSTMLSERWLLWGLTCLSLVALPGLFGSSVVWLWLALPVVLLSANLLLLSPHPHSARNRHSHISGG